jgi:hypothetical protein
MSLIAARWLASILVPVGALLFFAALAALLRRPRPRYLCPGPARPLLARVNPWARLVHERCLYDLHRVRPVEGWITCPECACRSTPRQLRRPSRWLGPVALSLLLLVPGVASYHLVTRGQWREAQRALPTTAIILMKRAWPDGPGRVHPELERRIGDGSMRSWQAPLVMPSLIGDLRGEADWNTERIAVRLLRCYSGWAEPYLQGALNSESWRHRRQCAALLRSYQPLNPSDALIRVTVESLRSSEQGRLGMESFGSHGFNEQVNFLRRHVGLAEHHLVAGLESNDGQQRLYCAFVLGISGLEERAGIAAPILAESLRSNSIEGDAKMAVYGLAGLGQAAIPCLEALLVTDDQQQRKAALLLLERLAGENSDSQLSRLISRGRGIRLDDPDRWQW